MESDGKFYQVGRVSSRPSWMTSLFQYSLQHQILLAPGSIWWKLYKLSSDYWDTCNFVVVYKPWALSANKHFRINRSYLNANSFLNHILASTLKVTPKLEPSSVRATAHRELPSSSSSPPPPSSPLFHPLPVIIVVDAASHDVIT